MTRKLRPFARRGALSADLGVDALGFVHVRVTNPGADMVDGVLAFAVPWRGDGHWIARVDPGGHPAFEAGAFEVLEGAAGDPEICWNETEVRLAGDGRPTDLRFFVGVTETAEEFPVRLELGREGSDERLRLAAVLHPPELPQA